VALYVCGALSAVRLAEVGNAFNVRVKLHQELVLSQLRRCATASEKMEKENQVNNYQLMQIHADNGH